MSTKLIYLFLAILLTGSLLAQGVDPGTENLTHSWTFEDETANDYVGGANGWLEGGALITDGVLWISDQGQWMEMPGDLIALNTYDEITLEAWFTPLAEANTGYTMLAFFGDVVDGVGVDSYFITAARGDDKSLAAITCGVYTNPYLGETGADGPEYDDGELHHMVSTLTDDEITLYIDGELTGATYPLDENNSIALLSPNRAFLAKSAYDVDPTWLGDIDEINIYNRALTADEVLYLALQGPSTTDVKENPSDAMEFCLRQNYPNPFNPVTNISFDLPAATKVRVAVYDVLGQELTRLVDGITSAGRHTVQFDGRNLSSGLYLCRMDLNHQVFTTRMILLK
jgi:hypothetical protein